MDTTYVVYVGDTIRGGSDRRHYKTLSGARKRFDELARSLRRNGHNGVVLATDQGVVIDARP
jgi:hypothetical protein